MPLFRCTARGNYVNNNKLMGWLILICLSPFSAWTIAQPEWRDGTWVQRDIAYREDTQQRLDIYWSAGAEDSQNPFDPTYSARPTLFWIHGGGWIVGDKAQPNLRSLIDPYLQSGWRVISINYRQGANTAPQAVDDSLCAYRFIEDNLAAANMARHSTVVSGSSAGGHLALTVGLWNSSNRAHPCRAREKPAAIVNIFGITDIAKVDEFLADPSQPPVWKNYARIWAGSAAEVAAISATYSPMQMITDAAPPIINIHGTQDRLVPYAQAQALHEQLTGTHHLYTIPNGGHGNFSPQEWTDAYDVIMTFLGGIPLSGMTN